MFKPSLQQTVKGIGRHALTHWLVIYNQVCQITCIVSLIIIRSINRFQNKAVDTQFLSNHKQNRMDNILNYSRFFKCYFHTCIKWFFIYFFLLSEQSSKTLLFETSGKFTRLAPPPWKETHNAPAISCLNEVEFCRFATLNLLIYTFYYITFKSHEKTRTCRSVYGIVALNRMDRCHFENKLQAK